MIAHSLPPRIVACANNTTLVSAGVFDRRCCAALLSAASSSSSSSLPLQSPIVTRRASLVYGSLAMALTSFPMVLPLSSLALDSADEEELEQWYRYEGNGFALSVPPDFDDIREPENLVDGPLYGNKAKPKPFAARFASSDRSEVVSVVVRQSSQLKLSFLAVRDVSDLGSLREAADIFIPAGAKVYAARTIKSSDEDRNRTYYYYEFASGDNYIALEAGASRGNVIVVGVTAPKRKWKDDSRKLRLMAASFSLL